MHCIRYIVYRMQCCIQYRLISFIMTYDIVYQPTISYIMTYDIVYHDLQYRISTYNIVYQPTISYVNLRYRISTYDIVYPSYQPCDCHQPYSSKRKQSVSPNMPPTPLKRGRSLGQKEGQEALDMWCPRAQGCLWQR